MLNQLEMDLDCIYAVICTTSVVRSYTTVCYFNPNYIYCYTARVRKMKPLKYQIV